MFKGQEKKFQRHTFEYLIRENRYAVLEQDEITDAEYYFAENHLIAMTAFNLDFLVDRSQTLFGNAMTKKLRFGKNLFLITSKRTYRGLAGRGCRVHKKSRWTSFSRPSSPVPTSPNWRIL